MRIRFSNINGPGTLTDIPLNDGTGEIKIWFGDPTTLGVIPCLPDGHNLPFSDSFYINTQPTTKIWRIRLKDRQTETPGMVVHLNGIEVGDFDFSVSCTNNDWEEYWYNKNLMYIQYHNDIATSQWRSAPGS